MFAGRHKKSIIEPTKVDRATYKTSILLESSKTDIGLIDVWLFIYSFNIHWAPQIKNNQTQL